MAARLTDKQFQSTPPSRGATQGIGPYVYYCGISIHAPLAGGDVSDSEVG